METANDTLLSQLVKVNETLALENESLKADISLTANSITRLLKTLGIMQPDGTIDFKISKLLRTLPGMLMNEGKLMDQFSFLADLNPIIEKYTSHEAGNNK